MKIEIDKITTTLSEVAKVKADMKEFKATYSDGYLLTMFEESTGEYVNGEVISAKVEAFPAGYHYDNETHFHVHLVVDNFIELFRVDYFTNLSGNIETDFFNIVSRQYENTYKIRKYSEDNQ